MNTGVTLDSTPPARPFGRVRVDAPTGREAAAFDRTSIEQMGVPDRTLMENAGRSAALILDRLFPRGSVLAFAGSGNNGGDALVLARTLAAWGRDVAVVPASGRVDQALLHAWPMPVLDPDSADVSQRLADASVVVDGILGTGLKGPPRAPQAAWIQRIDQSGRPLFALDVPSGVEADTGAVAGEAVRAAVTVAFGAPKLGTVLQPGRVHTGRLIGVEIGFPPAPGDFGARLITPGWAAHARPTRSPDTHKNRVGALLLLAGRSGMAGAAVLSARAALRSGAGLVRVASTAANRPVLQETVPEAIFVDRTDDEALGEALDGSRAVVAGPGMGLDHEARAALATVLDRQLPVLLDADALTLLSRQEESPVWSSTTGGRVLLTPHPGEMARLTGSSADQVQGARVASARAYADSTRGVLLLKGAPSIVAAPDGRVWVDTQGSSDLAVGGMGDVLAGAAGAFLAQGADAETAGCLALHYSGRAHRIADRGAGLIPSDVVEALPIALRESGPGDTDLPFPFVLFDQDAPR
jgi:hydroxyethylthiazole kinase-like uncharacterized protein yjeF